MFPVLSRKKQRGMQEVSAASILAATRGQDLEFFYTRVSVTATNTFQLHSPTLHVADVAIFTSPISIGH